ncbi:conserved Plasmodium protein, unknown function [Plasmodium ovale]|uniref:Tetratricopeptide repeat protein n=2 Tax=Plasmodium ovale TaxID=36330 RepID=A0A1A8X7I4_PLAOA|nr:conserved Plasmodium protein, unknown function [Plasmodium ovale curtisi]SBT00574.1 conserved Plasmodium protein, unknown function [Plasmodium ovale curtisi]SCP04423.1 conserved Plasmodium protein, unknown function [Plasmodium ovale]
MEEDFHIDEAYLKSLSEKYKDVDHPLFMDELPKDIGENEDLVALYNLMISDENELSLAKNYKEVGNDYYKDGLKYYDDALISYSKGIDVLNRYLVSSEEENRKRKYIHQKEGKPQNVPNKRDNKLNDDTKGGTNSNVIRSSVYQDQANVTNESKHFSNEGFGDTNGSYDDTPLNLNAPKEEAVINRKEVTNLLSDLYCNRAIIHFKKKRYVKCLDDCKKSFALNGNKYKSVYYSILCSYYLEIYTDSYKYVNLFDDLLKNEDIKCFVNLTDYEKIKKEVLSKYEHYLEGKKKNEEERRRHDEMEKNKINIIEDILRKRNIQMIENVYNTNSNIIPVFYLDSNMYIHFTVFLIYMENNIIDTILDFAENNCIMDYYDIVKKNKESNVLFCYIELANDTHYMIDKFSYICDVINEIKLFSRILSIHIIESEEANRQFRLNKNVIPVLA